MKGIPGMTACARVSIVVLNWNGLKDTVECLESVQKIDYPNLDVVVVDNGSADGSPTIIRERFPQVSVIETGRNLGYTGGNNCGIRHALTGGADWVFLLNNDAVLHPAAVDALAEVGMRHPHVGALGAKIYTYGTVDEIWYAGARWRPESASFIHIGQGQTDRDGRFSQLEETDYACGCAMLVRADTFQRVGLFDPRFFLLFEESDWCYRARRLGYRSLFVPEAKVWHKRSVSFGGRWSPLYAYFWSRNRLLWIENHLLPAARLAAYRVIARGLGRSAHRSLSGQGAARLTMAAELLGVVDYLRRRFGDCPAWVRARSSTSRVRSTERVP